MRSSNLHYRFWCFIQTAKFWPCGIQGKTPTNSHRTKIHLLKVTCSVTSKTQVKTWYKLSCSEFKSSFMTAWVKLMTEAYIYCYCYCNRKFQLGCFSYSPSAKSYGQVNAQKKIIFLKIYSFRRETAYSENLKSD